MNMTSPRLKELGLIDLVIPEPLGGAHRNIEQMANTLSQVLQENLLELQSLPISELIEKRYQRFMQIGNFEEG
jgi:acetyl-CoA carboxylase carboxyl transferase subunit alpha